MVATQCLWHRWRGNCGGVAGGCLYKYYFQYGKQQAIAYSAFLWIENVAYGGNSTAFSGSSLDIP
jgi:hypothetical protein